MSKKEKIIFFLKWLSITPSAILSYFVALWGTTLIFSISLARFIDDASGWPTALYYNILPNIAAGYSFVYIASNVAPRHNKTIAIIFATLAIFMSGAGVATIIIYQEYGILSAISTGIGSIMAAYRVHKNFPNK